MQVYMKSLIQFFRPGPKYWCSWIGRGPFVARLYYHYSLVVHCAKIWTQSNFPAIWYSAVCKSYLLVRILVGQLSWIWIMNLQEFICNHAVPLLNALFLHEVLSKWLKFAKEQKMW